MRRSICNLVTLRLLTFPSTGFYSTAHICRWYMPQLAHLTTTIVVYPSFRTLYLAHQYRHQDGLQGITHFIVGDRWHCIGRCVRCAGDHARVPLRASSYCSG